MISLNPQPLELLKEYSGREFNARQRHPLVKLTCLSECHNGFQFADGLNVDTKVWDPSGSCRPGGIYFCDEGDVSLHTNYASSPMIFYRRVTIPDDARVYVEQSKFKADKLVLGPRMLLCDLLKNDDVGLQQYLIMIWTKSWNELVQFSPIWDWMDANSNLLNNEILEAIPIHPKDRNAEGMQRFMSRRDFESILKMPAELYTDETYRMLIENDISFGHIPRNTWPRAAWVALLNKRPSWVISTEINEAFFDEEMIELLIKKGRFEKGNVRLLPPALQTREMWEKHVLEGKYVKGTDFIIPDKLRDRRMFDFLVQHGAIDKSDVNVLGVEYQTSEWWADAVRNKTLRDKNYIPRVYESPEMYQLLMENAYVDLCKIPYEKRQLLITRQLLDAVIARGKFHELSYFPQEFFDQKTYNALYEKGFILKDIPKPFQTHAMYLNHVQQRRILNHVDIPPEFLDTAMWEALVGVNATQFKNVPKEMHTAAITAIAKKRGYAGKTIAKRRKRKDWSR